MLLRLFILVGILILTVVPGQAQNQEDDATRDPWVLAERLLGFDASFVMPPPTPLYTQGDTAEFWVTKTDSDTPTKVEATLAATTRDLYLWVEDGLTYTEAAMAEAAQELQLNFLTLRLKAVYGEPTILPQGGAVQDLTSLLDLPDVDNDPHLFILYASDLGAEIIAANFHDSLPAQIAPGGYSNQHELLAINTSVLPDAPLNNRAFNTLLTHAFYEYLAHEHTPNQPQWLKEGLGIFITRMLEMPDVSGSVIEAYFQNPNVPLGLPVSMAGAAVEGGQQLFFDYVRQRFGFVLFQDVFAQSGPGLTAFDRALAKNDLIDPLTGDSLTGLGLFADFVAATAITPFIQTPFGDGRYTHILAQLPEGTPPLGLPLSGQLDATLNSQTVNQFGTRYYYIVNEQPAAFNFTFTGHPTTERLPFPEDRPPEDRFYWSGDGTNRNTSLTRSFDLTDVETATLHFDTWYELNTEHNYVYVEVSTDGGTTWAMLTSGLSSERNRYGQAYGPGYTGVSNPEGVKPFPFIGVLFDNNDGVTITEVTAGSPASRSSLQNGDVMIGYDGQLWPGTPDIIGLLANYEPGDTLNLYIERDGERLEIPVILDAHPTRQRIPETLWVAQEIDLSAYTGQEIQLRFEYISQPDAPNQGFAVDNIAIPEINYRDDAESDGDWEMNGFQNVDNRITQNFLVQYLSTGSESERRPPRVRRLIGPHDETTGGTWRFDIGPDEVIIYAISGLNHNTYQPGRFELAFSTAGA